jgi:hypothetical protein
MTLIHKGQKSSCFVRGLRLILLAYNCGGPHVCPSSLRARARRYRRRSRRPGIGSGRRAGPTATLTASVPKPTTATSTTVIARGGSPARCFRLLSLALSWSPTYCADEARSAATAMSPAHGPAFAFVLHGLWPQFERGWPRDCRSPDRGFVPATGGDRMLDIMPSKRLVFHEYRTHGTCFRASASTAISDLARQLYEKIKIPRRFRRAHRRAHDDRAGRFRERIHGRQPTAPARHDRVVRRPRQPPPRGAHLLRQGRSIPRLRAQRGAVEAVPADRMCCAAGAPGRRRGNARSRGRRRDELLPGPRERRL